MTSSEDKHLPQHVAIIMDGNNRYAKKYHMQKGEGHREGKEILDPIVDHCILRGIPALTVFAFSSENWNRPQFEVDLLMALLEETIHEQLPRMEQFNIALRFIGDRSRLSSKLRELMTYAEERTASFTRMTLTIAISYGGMWDIAQAAQKIAQAAVNHEIDISQIDAELFGRYVSLADLPPVDLLIRTAGDYRLSNFLLWQTAYAELYFTQSMIKFFSRKFRP